MRPGTSAQTHPHTRLGTTQPTVVFFFKMLMKSNPITYPVELSASAVRTRQGFIKVGGVPPEPPPPPLPRPRLPPFLHLP